MENEDIFETNISQRLPSRTFKTLKEDLGYSIYFFLNATYTLPKPIMDTEENDFIRLTPFTAYDTTWVPEKIQELVKMVLVTLNCTIDIPLQGGEEIYYLNRPNYGKNVLIMSIMLFILLSMLFLGPAMFISLKTHPDTRGILLNILMYILGAFYIILLFYTLLYRTFYKKMTVHYILTNQRAIITGYRPVISNRMEAHSKDNVLGGTTLPYYYSTHRYQDITELSFLPDNATELEDGLGSIYFGFEVENYILPFSILTYATSLGFERIKNVPEVLNMMLYFAKQANSVIQKADLLQSQPEKKFVKKSHALCGLGRSSINRSGIISAQQYYLLTSENSSV
mmetsp:Transcript_6996/g.10264  ORF Transcript_6996/g.10264 Transcript_6996/m.10264 type:complete len:340 (-) Transcript_6996:18-1037(-)